ncbi:hypothetical protein PI125_g26230 [Phytophthora idaei]|nr:hypothetical protein PI125_g26230 [Phytophthora idaei]KAG3122761.1 hypothetical protein PI126_g24013 [Phytophthora idaei]
MVTAAETSPPRTAARTICTACLGARTTRSVLTAVTNFDLYGGDIKHVYGLQPGNCCATCLRLFGLHSHEQLLRNDGLLPESGMSSQRVEPGIISAVIDSYTSDKDHTPKLYRFLANSLLENGEQLLRSTSK